MENIIFLDLLMMMMQYSVNSKNYDTPHYAIFSMQLLFCPS